MSYICSSTNFNVMISISEVAKNRVIQLMKDDGFNHLSDFVRVGVKSGGCSGLSYDMKFDAELLENDKLFEDNEIKIVVDKKSAYVINECPQRQMSDVENCRSRAIHSLIIDNVPKKVSATSEFEGKFLYT